MPVDPDENTVTVGPVRMPVDVIDSFKYYNAKIHELEQQIEAINKFKSTLAQLTAQVAGISDSVVLDESNWTLSKYENATHV